ncbi:MAG: hypothetical protein JRM87_00165 [Nitrososphaerota archaeon]|nr:hypothetical protein [Nitrososphaerota archaeon]
MICPKVMKRKTGKRKTGKRTIPGKRTGKRKVDSFYRGYQAEMPLIRFGQPL